MWVQAKPGCRSLRHQEGTLSPVPPACQGCRQQREALDVGAPRQRGAAVGPQTRGVTGHGTAKGGQGLRHRRQKGQRCATARKSSRSPPPPIVHSALSLLSLHTQNQAGNYHNSKAGTEFLFWKTFRICSSFGSYRMKPIFFMEGVETISWKWANKVKMKYFKLQENAWIQIQAITDF